MKTLCIKIKSLVHELLRFMGYKLHKIGPYSLFDFESFLYRHLAVHGSLTFLQIGANDGVMNDPIYQFNVDNKYVVSGFALEPLPDVYEKLVRNYEYSPSIKTFNLAIHASEPEMTLYRVKPSKITEVPVFARGIASFDHTHWQKTTLVPNSDYMEEVKVKCISFPNFLKNNGINKLDLLLLDTEGYDFEILMSIDFSKIMPKIIRFEHGLRNQVMSPENFMTICAHLNKYGYQVIAESYDATAYLLEPSDLVF